MRLGCPTCADGERQSDWIEHLEKLESAEFAKRRVAIFDTGDQMNYPASPVDAIGILHDMAAERGAKLVGYTAIPMATTSPIRRRCMMASSLALALDEGSQANKTVARINQWLTMLC